MKFNHVDNKIPSFAIERIDGPEFRTYKINGGESEYPSITSVLNVEPKPFLHAWRKKVGTNEAARITAESASVGTKLHDVTEKYLLNELNIKSVIPTTRELFLSYKSLLDRIDNVRALETFLYSDTLKIAGTVDCIAEFDGKLSIIDFKNARKRKKLQWVQGYFLQCTFYALAYYEMTGEMITQIVLPVAVWDLTPQLFIDTINKSRKEKIKDLRSKFEEKFGI